MNESQFILRQFTIYKIYQIQFKLLTKYFWLHEKNYIILLVLVVFSKLLHRIWSSSVRWIILDILSFVYVYFNSESMDSTLNICWLVINIHLVFANQSHNQRKKRKEGKESEGKESPKSKKWDSWGWRRCWLDSSQVNGSKWFIILDYSLGQGVIVIVSFDATTCFFLASTLCPNFVLWFYPLKCLWNEKFYYLSG